MYNLSTMILVSADPYESAHMVRRKLHSRALVMDVVIVPL